MGSVKWIKVETDIFDNRKLRHLRSLPNGDKLALMWIMLLALAGRCNDGGKFYLTRQLPYTPHILARELKLGPKVVEQGLQAMEQLQMLVKTREGHWAVRGWEDHQNLDQLERLREKNRQRQKKWYDKHQKPNADLTQPNAAEEEEEAEEEKEEDADAEAEAEEAQLQAVAHAYQSFCTALPQLRSMTRGRREAVSRLLRQHSLEEIRQAFQKANRSRFLKGADGGWKAGFDWLVEPEHLLKVLEGTYDDRWQNGRREPDEDELAAIRRIMEEDL